MFLCKINQLSNHINLGQFTEIYWDGISQEWVQFYTFSLSFVLTFSSPSSVLPSYLFSIIRSYLFSPFFRPTFSPLLPSNRLLPFLPSYLFSILRSYLFFHFFCPSVLPFLSLLLSFRPTFSPPPSFQPFITFPSFRPTVSPPPSFNLLLPFLPSYLFSHFVFPSLLPLQTSNYLYHTLQASYQCRIYSVSRNMVFQSE